MIIFGIYHTVYAQSVGAITDVIIQTMGEQKTSNTTNTNNTIKKNNNSNSALGSLFLTGEDRLTSYNRINGTFTKLTEVMIW
jgi:outer membrane autotransporter protein